MMIRTKLKIVIYLCIALAAISSIVVIYSFRHMARKVEERREIRDVVRGIFDLTILADEYLLYHEKRPLVQWNQKYNDLANLIDIGSDEPTHRSYLVSLEDNYREVKNLFSRLTSTHSSSRSALCSSRSARAERPSSSIQRSTRGRQGSTALSSLFDLKWSRHSARCSDPGSDREWRSRTACKSPDQPQRGLSRPRVSKGIGGPRMP